MFPLENHVFEAWGACWFFQELPWRALVFLGPMNLLSEAGPRKLRARRGSDTATGFVIGCVSGTLWGLLDVYGRLMRRDLTGGFPQANFEREGPAIPIPAMPAVLLKS